MSLRKSEIIAYGVLQIGRMTWEHKPAIDSRSIFRLGGRVYEGRKRCGGRKNCVQ